MSAVPLSKDTQQLKKKQAEFGIRWFLPYFALQAY
jgi:hypothetical protein